MDGKFITIGRAVLKARENAKLLKDPVREADLRRFAASEHYEQVLSVVLEFEQDAADSIAKYERNEQERTMDAGGLAWMQRLRAVLEALKIPVAKEVEAPKS